ncbi:MULTISPECIES: hypothetical protein [Kordiimonas]|jgi:hypothetical protein|uniref:hypothetical protein n=1 Tax=Kordiimonas TaxID=288021 RepID=UPI00257D49B6|nr:hypothetical protein [Kordiimonas sp. UBA4487]
MMKKIYAILLSVLLAASLPAHAENRETIKVWFTIHDSPDCPIDSSQLVRFLYSITANRKDVPFELWINGQPKGLTLKLSAHSKLIEDVCVVSAGSQLVEYLASGLNKPNNVKIYEPETPLLNGVKSDYDKEKVRQKLTETVNTSWTVGIDRLLGTISDLAGR